MMMLSSGSSNQVLTFVEPTTNVVVKLVGAMHYNPLSISIARNTCEELVNSCQLSAVIVESCPKRWNRTLAWQPENSIYRRIFDNEMQAAAEVASRNNLPVILGDQDIESTNRRMKEAFIQSAIDLLTPWNGGWSSIYRDITKAAKEVLPQGSQYLGATAFANPFLLAATPVSLVRYPLSFLLKSPMIGIPLITLLALSLTQVGDSSFVEDTLLGKTGEILTSVGTFTIEIALIARVFLVALLDERNQIIADNILKQCRVASSITAISPLSKQGGGVIGTSSSLFQDILKKFSGSTQPEKSMQINLMNGENTNDISSPKVVVAILGMAHCNGVMKILQSYNTNE